MGCSFFVSLYLHYIKGFNPQAAGFILVSQPIVQAIFSPLAGRFSDRIEPRLVASSGMAFTVVGLLTFIFLSKDTTIAFVIAGLVLSVLG
jgi:predicted MFS family arabinose efflux permease